MDLWATHGYFTGTEAREKEGKIRHGSKEKGGGNEKGERSRRFVAFRPNQAHLRTHTTLPADKRTFSISTFIAVDFRREVSLSPILTFTRSAMPRVPQCHLKQKVSPIVLNSHYS